MTEAMATAKRQAAKPQGTTSRAEARKPSSSRSRDAEDQRAEDEKADKRSSVPLTEDEESSVQDKVPHRSPVVFEIIRRSGEEEINRPLSSLWWSGLVAGLSIGFSVLAQALLRVHLPQGEWTPLIEKLGYTVGFAIVILARQQLFTENTITAVVPVMARDHARNLALMLRLWAVVLAANLLGAVIFSVFLQFGGALDAPLQRAVHDISAQVMDGGAATRIGRGVVSGFLIASMVWILAGIEEGRLGIIVLITYTIALGGFDHIVAGSVEASYLVIDGTHTMLETLIGFFLPTLLGNVLGGTAIFTLLSYGQIRAEMKEQR